MFFGVTYNAASSIATTVNGLVKGLVNNVIQAFRPAIIKSYAAEDMHSVQRYIEDAITFMLLLYGCLFTPFFIEMPYLIELWLSMVPYSAVTFCRLLLIASVVSMISNVITILIHATGKIKALSFVSGSIYLLALPIIYLFYVKNNLVDDAYYILIITNVLICVSNTIILNRLVPTINIAHLIMSIIKSVLIVMLASFPTILLFVNMNSSIMRLFSVSMVQLICIVFIVYSFVLDKATRKKIKQMIWL